VEFFTHRVFSHKKVLTHPESISGHYQTSLAQFEGECWNRQPKKGNVNPRKEISYCGITICRTYIVQINIGDDSVSLVLTTIE